MKFASQNLRNASQIAKCKQLICTLAAFHIFMPCTNFEMKIILKENNLPVYILTNNKNL